MLFHRVVALSLVVNAMMAGPAMPLQATSAPPPLKPAAAGARVHLPAADAAPTDQIIITWTRTGSAQLAAESTSLMQRLSERAGLEVAYFRPMSGGAHVLKLPRALNSADLSAVLKALAQDPSVAAVEPDTRVFPMFTPNDLLYPSQWHYVTPTTNFYGANLPGAWNLTTGSASVVMAVLDSGVLTDHPDLATRWVPGYDMVTNVFTANDGDGRDGNASDPGDWSEGQCGDASGSSWHGTHVAGTMGAATNNGVGVAGINWVSKIQSVRVLGRCGGTMSDILDGIRWAAGLSVPGVPNNPTPSKVLNLSLGGGGTCSTLTQAAIDAAVAAGAVVVVAAGNSNLDAANFTPANCNNILSVASNNRAGGKAYYSNFGAVVDIAAPGGETNVTEANGVISTLNAGSTTPSTHNYVGYQGTSMAAPHVAGVVSLMLSVNPMLTPAQVYTIVRNTVTPFPAGSSCNTSICGPGILNAQAAVAQALALNTLTNRVYLPMLVRAGTSTPPVNPGVLVNGNFEAGAAGWMQGSTNDFPQIVNSDLPFAPRSGSYLAWLGGASDEAGFIQQTITVPSTGATYLEFYQRTLSNDGPGYDTGWVKLNGNTIPYTVDLASGVGASGWVRQTINLSAYAGQQVILSFEVETDSTDSSSWFIDDIAFTSIP